MRCLITGAAGQVAYSLIPMIGNGNAFGHFQAIDLVLFDLELQKKRLEGIRMEIEDSNFKMISSITCTVDPEVAFKDASIVIFIGSKPRTQGMNRSDLLTENKKIFFEQATLMKRLSKPDVKILVVGNPANCNALIIAETAKEIPRENITSLMRLDHNRVISAIALHKGIQFHKISNSFVFGNHSPTLCPCLTKMAVNHQHFPQDDTFHKWVNNSLIPVKDCVNKECKI
ncbi:Malate dehydrogenase [Thelohanellus kitauei]|uniref:Malate dehydrogenase, cytoplasmic n=1 Tax=Thelohanellus kitauei TaxID=669202 RepID=A0A0C2IDW1_THEKT|nr:Malate dehydrogenase [Thelohanellus kitauei]